MAQRNNPDPFDQQINDQRSGYGYQQEMPQRNDFGGHRGRNEFDRDRQFRGMNEQQWQDFNDRSTPQTYRMDFDRNRQSYGNPRERSERPGRNFSYQGNSSFDRDTMSGTNDMGYRSASSDMPSADRYRTRGFDDDGPGLYGGSEDYGHAGYQERFDYGANRYPNPDMQRGSYTGAGNRGDGSGAAWSYERADQWNREAHRGPGDFGSNSRTGMNQRSNTSRSFSQGTGPHRGKGPKNYSRSDDRIQEDVCECLMQDADVDASEIEVKVSSGEVTLTGTVNSKEEKRRAEDAVEQLSGVKDIHNELRVESSNENRSHSASSSNGEATSSNGQSSTNRSSASRSSTRVS